MRDSNSKSSLKSVNFKAPFCHKKSTHLDHSYLKYALEGKKNPNNCLVRIFYRALQGLEIYRALFRKKQVREKCVKIQNPVRISYTEAVMYFCI